MNSVFETLRMINYIKNLFALPLLYFTFIKNLKYQKKYIEISLASDIEVSKKNNDNSLDNSDYKKITTYYGLAVPAILGEFYCMLRAEKMSDKERLASTYLGGLTGLFDDFFDKRKLSETYILKLIDQPYDMAGNNENEKLFLKFYQRAIENSKDANLLKSYFFKVFDAQVQSKKQLLKEIEAEEIKNITFLKGGISLLFYWSVFSDCSNEEEEILVFKLGSIGQLENDIFDVYKDYQEGIKTLLTIEKNIANIKKIYTSLFEEIILLIQQFNYPVKNKRKFLRFISFVICRGFVCLDMLEKKEEVTEHLFNLSAYNRKDLICDMENPINFIKLIHYYAKAAIL